MALVTGSFGSLGSALYLSGPTLNLLKLGAPTVVPGADPLFPLSRAYDTRLQTQMRISASGDGWIIEVTLLPTDFVNWISLHGFDHSGMPFNVTGEIPFTVSVVLYDAALVQTMVMQRVLPFNNDGGLFVTTFPTYYTNAVKAAILVQRATSSSCSVDEVVLGYAKPVKPPSSVEVSSVENLLVQSPGLGQPSIKRLGHMPRRQVEMKFDGIQRQDWLTFRDDILLVSGGMKLPIVFAPLNSEPNRCFMGRVSNIQEPSLLQPTDLWSTKLTITEDEYSSRYEGYLI